MNESVNKMSNHYPVTAKVDFLNSSQGRPTSRTKKHLSYCKGDYQLLNNLIAQKPFKGICWSNTSVLSTQWLQWLEELIQISVPKRTAHRSQLAPWITSSTSHMLKKMNTEKKKCDFHQKSSSELKMLKQTCATSVENDNANYQIYLHQPQKPNYCSISTVASPNRVSPLQFILNNSLPLQMILRQSYLPNFINLYTYNQPLSTSLQPQISRCYQLLITWISLLTVLLAFAST